MTSAERSRRHRAKQAAAFAGARTRRFLVRSSNLRFSTESPHSPSIATTSGRRAASACSPNGPLGVAAGLAAGQFAIRRALAYQKWASQRRHAHQRRPLWRALGRSLRNGEPKLREAKPGRGAPAPVPMLGAGGVLAPGRQLAVSASVIAPTKLGTAACRAWTQTTLPLQSAGMTTISVT